MKRLFILIAAALMLVSCAEEKKVLPQPAALFEEISKVADVQEMFDVSEEMLEDVIGISPELYDSAVYMISGTGVSPEEIIIVRAKTKEDADTVKEKLEKRLSYIKKSAENYLIEEMPTIEKAVIRQDDLTVSLIVSKQVDTIVAVYKEYK